MTHPSAPSVDAQARPNGKVRLGFSLCGAGISFHAIVGFGAKERAADLGADLSIDSVFTPVQQAAAIQQFAAAHVDVLIVDALESEIVLPALLETAAAGIPVIAADGSIHGVEVACSVHSANVRGGELAAAFLVEQLRGRGTIAHLQGLLTSDNGLERSRGFHNVVDAHREIRIAEASAEWTRESGAVAMRELLAIHPVINAVFAHNDAQALGAVDAITEAGRARDVVIVGFDGIPEALTAIARGTIAATVRQIPQAMGRLAVELALRVHAGAEVPPVVETDVTLVTSANVAEASLETLPLFPPILRDLAERSATLAEERTLLRTLIDNLPDLIYVKDLDSRFLLVNEAAAAYIGASTHHDAVGKSDFDFFPHGYASKFREDEEAMLASGQPLINHEERTPAANGDTHWFSTTKVPTRNAGGNVVGLVGMSRDITRQKESEADRARLVEEQGALRRVATLVAAGMETDELFEAVSEEVVRLLDADSAAIGRFERGGSGVVVVGRSEGLRGIPLGTHADLAASPTVAEVHRTRRAARWSDKFYSSVAAPITVGGSVWGVLTAGSGRVALPSGTEERLERFGELMATAVANAESQAELAAAEARKSAMLESALDCIITIDRNGQILEFNPAAEATFGYRRAEVLGKEMAELIIPPSLREHHYHGLQRYLETGEGPVLRKRIEQTGLRSDGTEFPVELTVTPITLRNRRMFTAYMRDITERKQAEEERAGLLSGERAARADAEAASDRARELANEQAALRRVATLVAQGATPDELFSAVAEEVAGIIDIPVVGVNRYEADGTFTMVGIAGETDFAVGSRWPVEEEGIAGMILATHRPSRKDDYSTMPGQFGEAMRRERMISTVGVPIVVEGSIWGFMVAAAKPGKPIPADTEARLARFTELVATAVSNAAARSDLLRSRARLVSTADETRRRLERDLHDGIQQWLVALALKARKAAALSAAGESPANELSDLADDLVAVTDELREISRGIHPAILSDAGLDDALKALARRSAIRVDLDISFEHRYDPTLEATVYYVVAESITNAVKHAHASKVTVSGRQRSEAIELEIGDDGVGGADPRRGTGLIGLRDRVDTLGGTITFASPPGAGTTIRVKLPASPRDEGHPPLLGSGKATSASPSG